MSKMKIITNSVAIVAASVLLLSLFAQTMSMVVVDVDAQKTSREKACINPRNTQEKDPKFCARLIVIKEVEGGTAAPSDFTISVTSTSRDKPSPSTFQGSSSGTTVTLGQGSYQVTETNIPDNYDPSYSSDCTGTINAGQTKTCTITNTFTPPTGTLTVVKNVEGGTAAPSDFTISVTGNDPSPSTFQGSSSGTEVTLGEGEYEVTETTVPDNYDPSYSYGCFGSISAGQTNTCIVTNTYTAPQPATLTVYKEVSGGTAQASDITLELFLSTRSGSQCLPGQPQEFQGSTSGTTFTLQPDLYCDYQVLELNPQPGYSVILQGECGFPTPQPISPGQTYTCKILNSFIEP